MMSFRDHRLLATRLRSSDPWTTLGLRLALLSCLTCAPLILTQAALRYWLVKPGRCAGLRLLLVLMSVFRLVTNKTRGPSQAMKPRILCLNLPQNSLPMIIDVQLVVLLTRSSLLNDPTFEGGNGDILVKTLPISHVFLAD